MSVQKMGGAIALLYSGIPVLIAWLSTSAEQGLISATLAAIVVALLQCALRVMDIKGWGQRAKAENFELIGNVRPAGASAPNKGGGRSSFLGRVLIGE
ncbi:MAG: hypothetical protein AAF702_33050 [Chloroflexota bacterium]